FWSLYVVDDASGNTGSLEEWCLNFIPSFDAEEVPNLRFADKVTATWDAGPNATSYALYRGTPGQLVNLDDGSADGCLRGNTVSQQLTGLQEIPSPGSFFWYLVRGKNEQGEGPSGFQRLGGQIRARVMSSSGSCP